MTQQIINIGTSPNDRSGDPLRTAFEKANANFTDLYTQIGGLELDAVIPTQTGNNGLYLTTNGTSLSWGTVSSTYSLPAATTSSLGGVIVDGNTITISPTTHQITAVSQLPIQTGNGGQFLTTNGTSANWATVNQGLAKAISGWNVSNASVTLDNLTATFVSSVPTIKNTGGSSISFTYTTTNNVSGSISSSHGSPYLASNATQSVGSTFGSLGDTAVSMISDANNNHIYRVTWYAGPGIASNNGSVMIEKLF
jgi:hypothetical protein